MTYPIFCAFGFELEYMIVDRFTLDVKPILPELFVKEARENVTKIVQGPIVWSNELAAHVIELKTSAPATTWHNLDDEFSASLAKLEKVLSRSGATLLPTAMHPWMNPKSETRHWPTLSKEKSDVQDKIFDRYCHSWSNIQSAHLNLSFEGDEEFHRLHSAIRLVLPLIPALAASSPIRDRQVTGIRDTRLVEYHTSYNKVGCRSGGCIPDVFKTQEEYERLVIDPIKQDMKAHDPNCYIPLHWLNARGAIARFDRSAIEVRLADLQEAPRADLAVLAAVTAVVKGLVKTGNLEQQDQVDSNGLSRILKECITRGETAVIENPIWLETLGLNPRDNTARRIWRQLLLKHSNELPDIDKHSAQALEHILSHGTLSTRILDRLKNDAPLKVYQRLADCLENNILFI